MDTRPQPSHLPSPSKREQKFAKFDLKPGDEDLIAQLPAEQQAALRAQGSYAQRAEEMGIAVGTVRSSYACRASVGRNMRLPCRSTSWDRESPNTSRAYLAGPSGRKGKRWEMMCRSACRTIDPIRRRRGSKRQGTAAGSGGLQRVPKTRGCETGEAVCRRDSTGRRYPG